VNWTEFGKQLVSDKVYKYLSATIDKARWVLKSISLVNFPAVKGLPPVELAEYVHESVPPDTEARPTQTSDETAEVAPTIVEESPMSEEIKVVPEAQPETPATPPIPKTPVVLSDSDVARMRTDMEQEMRATLMAEYARLEETKAAMFAELMAKVREEREVVEFAEAATGSGRYALPTKADDLKNVLMDLPKDKRARVMNILKNVVEHGTVDFTEHGTTGGKAVKKTLDPEIAIALRGHLNSGGTMDIFFDANKELGAMSDYDLAEFGVGGNNG
jgi:hypothetical protein